MGKRILLAEDSLTIRKVFELTFAQSDVILTMVDNGDDAVRLAEETTPDLVVADVTLPGKDGYQVGEELSASEKARACPVLILCGTLSPFDEERFKKSGARGVLFKPFVSQELIDKVQDLLRGKEEVAGMEKGEETPSAEEPWDFSDILEEVEQESGKVTVSAAAKRGEDLLPGASMSASNAEGGMSLGEFDVSLEELEESPKEALHAEPGKPIEEDSGEASPESKSTVPHIEEEVFIDAPEAVTDLTKAIEAVEEIEELEDLEEVAQLQAESERPIASAAANSPEKEPLPEKEPPAADFPFAASATAGEESALREQFSARAREIFEKVAAEAVEKVLWEQMDRIVAEFSAKIQESVEAVAWEVIPPTAEALIREEISRIREQAEKKSP
jgi:DNA-binding response OmpR family regulator